MVSRVNLRRGCADTMANGYLFPIDKKLKAHEWSNHQQVCQIEDKLG
jgi:hypothetical protein